MPSQSTSAEFYKMNTGTATAGRVRPRRRTTRKRRSTSKRVTQRFAQINMRVVLIIAAVVVFAFMILVQNFFIARNDQNILALRNDLKTVTEANDSKSGKILKMQDLSELEKKAESYGMVKPGPEQYVYVVVDNPSDTLSGEAVQGEAAQ